MKTAALLDASPQRSAARSAQPLAIAQAPDRTFYQSRTTAPGQLSRSVLEARVQRATPSPLPAKPVDFGYQHIVDASKIRPVTAGRSIQEALTIGAPGDRHEREADEVASRVMRMAVPDIPRTAPPAIQRMCTKCQGELAEQRSIQRMCTKCEEKLHRQVQSTSDTSVTAATPIDALRDARAKVDAVGEGQPLPLAERAFFEPRFGADFSSVRVHADGVADTAVRSVGALAYTLGRDVVFRQGQYLPGTPDGRKLQGAASQRGAAVVQRAPVSVQRLGDPTQAPPTMPCAIATGSPPGSLGRVIFAKDSAAITPTAQATLEAIVTSWHGQPGAPQVRVDGYASTDGPQAHNWTLSCNRALAVQAVLTRPTSTGVPGIPAGSVGVFAQGATAEFSGGPTGNRRATVDVAAPTPPTPTPPAPTPPTPTPGPVCGPDVTGEVRAAVARTRATFGGWGAADREAHCDALDSYRTGGYAWDIVELHNNAWISGSYRPACATAGATPPCGSTVQIDTGCSYAGSPNYVIFGVMCRLCSDHYTATSNASGVARFTQPEMQSWIRLYKGPGVFSGGSGNFVASTQWADAGYNGWPGSASPAGDRNACGPTCPTPFTGPAFNVAWWRNDGLLSSPTRTLI
jgi:outer membrane protein OmpA-like peptidoglycan-associated protein